VCVCVTTAQWCWFSTFTQQTHQRSIRRTCR